MKHASPQTKRSSTRTKALVTGGLLALTAAGVGGAAFAAFTATTTASQADSSGTMSFVDISGGNLSVGASNIAPGDTIERAVTLTNNGSVDMVSANLTTDAPTTSSALDTDATNGLQMKVDRCSVAWTVGANPLTWTCGGTQTSVFTDVPVIGANRALPGLATTAGTPNHLRVTLTFPGAADNTFQDLDSVIRFTFNGVQRAGIPQ
jgi:hypothetical protein